MINNNNTANVTFTESMLHNLKLRFPNTLPTDYVEPYALGKLCGAQEVILHIEQIITKENT